MSPVIYSTTGMQILEQLSKMGFQKSAYKTDEKQRKTQIAVGANDFVAVVAVLHSTEIPYSWEISKAVFPGTTLKLSGAKSLNDAYHQVRENPNVYLPNLRGLVLTGKTQEGESLELTVEKSTTQNQARLF